MAAKRKPKTLKQMVTTAVAKSGLGKTAWCKKHGLNPRLVYRWESGDVDNPRIQKIADLAKALGVEYEAAEAAVYAAGED